VIIDALETHLKSIQQTTEDVSQTKMESNDYSDYAVGTSKRRMLLKHKFTETLISMILKNWLRII